MRIARFPHRDHAPWVGLVEGDHLAELVPVHGVGQDQLIVELLGQAAGSGTPDVDAVARVGYRHPLLNSAWASGVAAATCRPPGGAR
jgi:hypothetical protein